MTYAPIMDVQYLRQVSDIPARVSDERLKHLIDEAENAIREYCNDAYQDGLPLTYRTNIRKMVEFDVNRKTGLTSESLSRHSVGYVQDYPPDVYKGLKRRLTW